MPSTRVMRVLVSPSRGGFSIPWLVLWGNARRPHHWSLRVVTALTLGIIAGTVDLSTPITATDDLRSCAASQTLLSMEDAGTKAEHRSKSLQHRGACAGGQPRASQRHPPLRTRGITDRFGWRRARPAPAPGHHRVCQGGCDRRFRGCRPPAVRGREDRKCYLVLPPTSAAPSSWVLYFSGRARLNCVRSSAGR